MIEVKCANCVQFHTYLPDVCIPSVLFGMLVHERESMSEDEALEALGRLNVDYLWDTIGKVLDDLEEGVYDTEEDEEEVTI